MSKIADTEANATSLDGLVNDNALVPTLRNGPKPSYQYLVDGWNTEFDALISSFDNQGDTAINAINADVLTVENAKNSAISNINADVSAVDTERNSALDYINGAEIEVTSKVNDFNAIADTAISSFELESSNSIADFEAESQAAIIEMQKSRGFRRVGMFEDGFTYELANDVGIDSSGEAWVLTDISSLPFIVPAMTTPTDGVYTKVTYNSADTVINDKGGSVQDYIDYNLKVKDVNQMLNLAIDDSMIGYAVKTEAFNLDSQSGWSALSTPLLGGSIYRIMSKVDADLDGVVYWESGELEGNYAFLVDVNYVLVIARSEEINVTQWGAIPDDQFDNTPVLVAIANYVTSKGGHAVINFENTGVAYRWNQWKSDSSTQYWGGDSIMYFNNVDGVYINGNGCTLKAFDEIRMGSFDPDTGEAMTSRQTNSKYSNGCGNMFEFIGALTNIHIQDLTIDGNLSTRILGGGFGDTGYQVQEKGLRMIGTVLMCSVKNCNFSNLGVDGLALRISTPTGFVDPNVLFSNVKCLYNGRQGCSLVGGQNLRFENCDFSYTGEGLVFSSPGSGLDIEPEGGRYVTDCVFDSCTFSNNRGQGVLTAVNSDRMRGNVFENCIIQSATSNAIYTTAYEDVTPAIFSECTIMGRIIVCGNSHFLNCKITDIPNEQFPVVSSNAYLVENTSNWCKFDGCDFDLQFSRIGYEMTNLTGCKIKTRYDSDVVEFSGLGTRKSVNLLGWGGNVIIDMTTGVSETVFDWSGYVLAAYITTPDTKYAIDRNTGAAIAWREGGEFNKFSLAPETFNKRVTLSNNDRPTPDWGNADTCITFRTANSAIPTSGTYTRGTIVINYTVQNSGNSQAGLCTTAGDAGSTAVFKPLWRVDQQYYPGV